MQYIGRIWHLRVTQNKFHIGLFGYRNYGCKYFSSDLLSFIRFPTCYVEFQSSIFFHIKVWAIFSPPKARNEKKRLMLVLRGCSQGMKEGEGSGGWEKLIRLV